MLACAACGAFGAGPLCLPCDQQLAEGPSFLSPGGVLVVAAYGHRGTARRLVHALKYRGIVSAAAMLADAMAGRVPEAATALVPVRRAAFRRWRHGIDPAQTLARALAVRTGLPVCDVLRPAPWWPRHAGRGDAIRSRAIFTARVTAKPGWVLVDDVATSGATLDAAAGAFGGAVSLAIVATAPSRVRRSEGSIQRPPDLGGGVAKRSTRTASRRAMRSNRYLWPAAGGVPRAPTGLSEQVDD